MSGFDPRDPSWLRTYAGFQRAKRVFRSWRTKAEEAQLQRIEPLAKGISVYALFKWIGLTLRQDEGRQAYPFPFAAIQDYNSDSRHQEINSNYFISRIRRYASDQVCLPGKRLPLFVHGIAVLDAHVLVRCFRAWKAEYLRNRQLDDYYIVTYARRLFRLWIARSQAAKALRMRSARLALTASRAALRQIFLAWQHAQYLSRIVRQYIVPKRRLRTLDQFLQRVSRLNAQKCQQRLGFCHAITRRLARAFHVLASNRKATDQRIAISQVKDGLKWHTRSHMMMHDAHTLAGSAAVGPYMQQLQVPSSKLRALSAWMCRLKGHDPSRSAQRALTAVGAAAHTLRALLLAMRALAQHALHSRHIASAMSPWYPMQQKLRRGFRKWAADAQRRRRLRSAHHSVQASQRIRHLAELLSSWLLLTANRRVCQQVAHKVCCKRIQRQLVVSFHAWKDQYQRLALLKSNRKALLHQRDEELSRFRSLLAAKEVFGLQSSALRTWYLFSHEQKRARRFGSLWERMQRKCDLLRALDHWKVIASLSLIVTCWKKLWRGYRVRRLYYPAQYQYLLWYRKQVRRVLGFRRYSLQKRGMGILRTFHTHRLHRLLRYSISARCKHALRRWFAHFRQRRLHHRAQYNSSRYHMKVYAGMLLRRWQTRASWQRWQRSCYLSHYRAQLCAALRALHGHSQRTRRARQAVCLRKHRALSRFRQRLSVSYSRTAAYLLNSAALWFVRKYFLFLLQHSQRMTKSSSMRRRRLRMRRRGYLLRWYEQAVIRCASRRQAARWHALRLLATSLHRLGGYRWEYFNRQARLPSGSASCRIVRGVVSSFLREKLRQLISHCADSRDRQRWHQHTCNRMRRRKMRLALQLLLHFAQKAKAKLKGKGHAAKVKSGRLKNLSYQHLMDSSKLRALLLDDGAIRAHGHRWISKWYHRVQQRDRFREHMRNLLTIRRQTILHQAIHRMLPYLRRQKRRRKQAKAQRAQYLMKRAHEAFQTLRRLVRHARRNRLLGLRAYKANRVVVCCAYLNKWRTLARFWKLTRGCRFVILKLKLKLRDFFRLLSQRARRRRSRRQHMANRMFTKRVVHWLRRLRRRGQHLLRSASILRLVHRNHCLTQMKQALLQWRYIAVMKKRFLRMSRRFHLLPALRAWHTAYLTSARHSSALRVMHRTVASRTRRSVFDAWRLFAVQAMRGKLQTTIVRAQAAHGTRERAFYAWINAISQRRLLERYHVLQQRTAHITRARCFLRWQRLHAWHDNLNAAKLLAVWRNWRHCVRMYAKQRASLRLAKLFHVNRQVMSAWRVLLSRARRRGYYYAREELGRRRFLRKTYLRYFRCAPPPLHPLTLTLSFLPPSLPQDLEAADVPRLLPPQRSEQG